jgi:hypothetical protein
MFCSMFFVRIPVLDLLTESLSRVDQCYCDMSYHHSVDDELTRPSRHTVVDCVTLPRSDTMAGDNGDDATDWVTTDSSNSSRLIDPLQFSTFLFIVLLLFVFYLLLPRGVRKQYFYAHPKRHAWMARSGTSSSSRSIQARPNGIGLQVRLLELAYCQKSLSPLFSLTRAVIYGNWLCYGRFFNGGYGLYCGQ